MKEILIGTIGLALFFGGMYLLKLKNIKLLKNLFVSSYYFNNKKQFKKFLNENFNEAIVVKTNFPGFYLIFNLDILKFELKINDDKFIIISDKFVLFFQNIHNNIKILTKEFQQEQIGFNYYIIKNFNYIPNKSANEFKKIATDNKNIFYLYYIEENKNYPSIEMICNFKEKNCLKLENAMIHVEEKIINKYFSNLKFYHFLNGDLKPIYNYNTLIQNL